MSRKLVSWSAKLGNDWWIDCYWRTIASPRWVSFCCVIKWISYMYTYIPSLLGLCPNPSPIPPFSVIREHLAELPVLYSSFPLTILHTVLKRLNSSSSSVYKSVLLSQFVPHSTSPTVSSLYIAEDFFIHPQNRKSKGQIYPTCPHPRPNTPPTAEFGVWPPWQPYCLSLEDSQVHILGRDWNWPWTEKLLWTFNLSNFYQNIYLWIRLSEYCTDSPLGCIIKPIFLKTFIFIDSFFGCAT